MSHSIALLFFYAKASSLRVTLGPITWALTSSYWFPVCPLWNQIFIPYPRKKTSLPVAGPPCDVQGRHRQQYIGFSIWMVEPRAILSLANNNTKLNMQCVLIKAHMGSSLSEWH